ALGAVPVRCSDAENATNCCANHISSCGSGSAPAVPNILLIISDDQAYCSYGFMRGRTTIGIDDLTCRYRNPTGVSAKKSFVFRRDAYDPLTTGTLDVGVRTPTLDDL